MSNLTDVIEVFRNLSERENETMFAQGKLLAEAIEAGMKPKDITRECGIAAGKSSQTMLNRLKVGLIFGDDYCKDMDWSVHLIAATAPNVDYRDPYTHMYARAVIDTAIKGYVDNNGVHRPHTARTLKAAIRAAAKPASGKPKAETVYKGEIPLHAMIADPGFDGEILIQPERYYVEMELPYAVWKNIISDIASNNAPTLTITREPQPVTSPSVGGNEAAA